MSLAWLFPAALAALAALLLLRLQPSWLAAALWGLVLVALGFSAALLATIGWPQAWVLLGLLALAGLAVLRDR